MTVEEKMAGYRVGYKRQLELEAQMKGVSEVIDELRSRYKELLNGQVVLKSVTDKNTAKGVRAAEETVNTVLSDLFPDQGYRIAFVNSLYRGQYTHTHLEFYIKGETYDLGDQCSRGVGQIISLLLVVAFIEIRKSRRLLVLDEVINGVHDSVKEKLGELLKILVDRGYQIIVVEHGSFEIGEVLEVVQENGESRVERR